MAGQTTRKILDLPQSTGQCEEGPLIDYAMGNAISPVLRVRYDVEGYEDSDEDEPVWSPVWTSVVFADALAMRFTPESGTTEIMADAYSCVCEVINSEWLATLEDRFVDAHHELPPSYRHLMIFFDHYGCLEVIAASASVGSP